MGTKNPTTRRTPSRRRVRQPGERCPYQLTTAARRALLLEQIRAGIPHRLTEQEN